MRAVALPQGERLRKPRVRTADLKEAILSSESPVPPLWPYGPHLIAHMWPHDKLSYVTGRWPLLASALQTWLARPAHAAGHAASVPVSTGCSDVVRQAGQGLRTRSLCLKGLPSYRTSGSPRP